MRWALSSGLAALFLGGFCAPAAHAQYGVVQTPDGIAVSGTGEVLARPNVVEIGLRISASAKLANDALVKYRDVERRTLKAFADLNYSNLETRVSGVSVTNSANAQQMQQVMRGQPVKQATSKTQIGGSVVLRLKGVRELAPEKLMESISALLDAAADTGALVGPSAADLNQMRYYGNRAMNHSMARFILEDFDEQRERAYELAVAEARRRADRLAKLTGVTLGRVVAIQEISVSGETSTPRQMPYIVPPGLAAPIKSLANPRIEEDSFEDVPVRVKLMVRFAIAGELAGQASARQ